MFNDLCRPPAPTPPLVKQSFLFGLFFIAFQKLPDGDKRRTGKKGTQLFAHNSWNFSSYAEMSQTLAKLPLR